MRSIFTTLVLVAAASSALADPAAKPVTALHTDDCARARAQHKTCEISVDGEELTSELPRDHGERFNALTYAKTGSLIRLRRDFIAQIVKTADDL
jgi:hypothetical protein